MVRPTPQHEKLRVGIGFLLIVITLIGIAMAADIATVPVVFTLAIIGVGIYLVRKDRARKLRVQRAHSHFENGVRSLQNGSTKRALDELDRSLALHPLAAAYAFRGNALLLEKDFVDARDDFQMYVDLMPDDEDGLYNLSYLLATCADDQVRDGAKAVKLATRACELTHWKSWRQLGMLAAAFAESGDFDQAIEYGKKSLELAPDSEKPTREKRIAQFQERKPVRIEVDELKISDD